MKRLFVDMDGTLNEWGHIEAPEELYEEGYFLNRPPHEDVIKAVKNIIEKHPDIEVNVLSCYLSDSLFAKIEKEQWLDRYLPEVDDDHRIFVPYGEPKDKYVSDISRDDYLLDDYTENLMKWREEGGTGVKLLNGINNTRGTWNGMKISHEDPSLDGLLEMALGKGEHMKNRYYNEKYELSGTADELYHEAFFTENPDELAFIAATLENEGRIYGDEELKNKGFEVRLMEKREREQGNPSVAQMQLDYLEGYNTLFETDNYKDCEVSLAVYAEGNNVSICVSQNTKTDFSESEYSNAITMDKDEFLSLSQKDFERQVDAALYYAPLQNEKKIKKDDYER